MKRKILVVALVITITIMMAVLAISLESAAAQEPEDSSAYGLNVYDSCEEARDAGEPEVKSGPNSIGYWKDTVRLVGNSDGDDYVCERIGTVSDVKEKETEAGSEEQRRDSESSSVDTPGETQDTTEGESSTDELEDDGDGRDAGSGTLGTRDTTEVVRTVDTVVTSTREVHNFDQDGDDHTDYTLIIENTETHSVSTLPYTVVGKVNPLLIDTCKQLWGIGVNPNHVVPVRTLKNGKFYTEGRDYGRPMVDSIGFRHAKYDVCNNSPYDPSSTVTTDEFDQILMDHGTRLDRIEERLTTLEKDYADFKVRTQEILNDIVDIIQKEILEKEE